MLDAKTAHFLLAEILAFSAAARAAWTAARSSRTAWTAAFAALSSSASSMAFGAARWSTGVSLGAARWEGRENGRPVTYLVPTYRLYNVGFRPARTLPLGSFTALPPTAEGGRK